MHTEWYSGKCPCCSEPMLHKNSTSTHAFIFDACPHCGFADGEACGLDMTAAEVWDAVLPHHGAASVATLPATLAAQGISDDPKEAENVYAYAGRTRAELETRQLPHHRVGHSVPA